MKRRDPFEVDSWKTGIWRRLWCIQHFCFQRDDSHYIDVGYCLDRYISPPRAEDLNDLYE